MRVLSESKAEWKLVENWVRSRATADRPMQVLEAGCGRYWQLKMDDIQFELTGIDMDQAALDARVKIYHDLQHAVYGDLRTVELPAEQYDVIYCSYVLEHVVGVEQVLERFARWLKPGGIMVLRVPDRNSIHGFTVRITPFWFHVFFYRYFHHMPEAGKPGFPPYRTVHEKSIASRGMHEFARRHGLVVRDEVLHGDYRHGNRFMKSLIGAYARVVQVLSLGRVHTKASNLTLLIEKPAASIEPRSRGSVAAETRPALAPV